MEFERTEDGFEDYLKEKADQFRMHPSDSLWSELSAKMHKPRRWPYVLAGTLIFGLGIGVGVMIQKSAERSMVGESLVPDREISDARSSKYGNQPNTSFISDGPIEAQSRIIENFLLNTPLTEKKSSKRLQPTFSRSADPVAKVIAFEHPAYFANRVESTIPAAAGQTTAMISLPSPQPRSKRAAGNAQAVKDREEQAAERSSITTNILQTIDKIGKRTGIQFYVAPSFSYRRLVGQASKTNFNYSGFPYSANYGFPTDVNDAVVHKPAFGLEAGTVFTQNIGKRLRLKAGLQFNFNNYDIEAYSYMPEMAPFTAARQQGYGGSVSTLAYYRNANGFNKTWLRNSHFMVSIPVGFDATLFGNRKVRFNVASTIQPTYVLNNKSYLISTNLKNYAQEPSLYRNWNLNAGAEAYLSVDAGTYRWIVGPQVRYQLLSSYKEDYPIREHLVDYGFKIGIQKTLR
jgi:hypothetical protein